MIVKAYFGLGFTTLNLDRVIVEWSVGAQGTRIGWDYSSSLGVSCGSGADGDNSKCSGSGCVNVGSSDIVELRCGTIEELVSVCGNQQSNILMTYVVVDMMREVSVILYGKVNSLKTTCLEIKYFLFEG